LGVSLPLILDNTPKSIWREADDIFLQVLKGLKQNKCFTEKLKNIWRKLEDTRIRLPPRNKGLFILWDIENWENLEEFLVYLLPCDAPINK
jgi:hypothetical protein